MPVNRKLVGALTLLPLVYLLFFFAVAGMATVQGDGDPDNVDYLIPFGVLVALHIGTMVLIIALTIVYIRDAYRNPRIDENKRTFWAVVLFMGNMIAMPIYWWLYMRPGAGRSPSQSESSVSA